MRETAKARVGLFGIGLAAYWPQFPGLKERLERYHRHVVTRIEQWAEVIPAGLVDTVAQAYQVREKFIQAAPDLLVCHTATYATSAQVLPIVLEQRAPVLILNLQPKAALDYERDDTGEWLANCSACCVPELAHAFARAGVPFAMVSGMLFDDIEAWEQVREWCEAARVVRGLRGARFGFLGHTYPGMLDIYSDFTALQAQIGLHVEVLEMDDLVERVERATPTEIGAKVEEIQETFAVDQSVTREGLEWAARVAVGLDHLVKDFDLDALAFYYRGQAGSLFERITANMAVGSSLLTAHGVPVAGEGDLKTAVAMKVLDMLGAGGSFTEFYAMDFREGFLLMGHDGPGHIAISDRKPVLRALAVLHGKSGSGLSVEFSARHGRVTILGLTQTRDGRLRLVAAEGEALPGSILQIGNTNSRLRFALPPAAFINAWCEQGPTHHCALGLGHRVRELQKVARLLGLDLVSIG